MRKRIEKKNCVEVGYIKKTHGVKGDLTVVFHDEIIHKNDALEFLFFEIDGLLVPFRVLEEKPNTSSFRFKFIESKEEAQTYIGCKIYLDKEDIQIDEENISVSMLIGFTLWDKNRGKIGEVLSTDDFGGNIVLTVSYENDEVMIPYSEDFVTAFSLEESTLEMECPDGIFDLSE